MKWRFGFFLALLLMATMAPAHSVRATHESASPHASSANDLQLERLRAEELKKFQAWRADIPDYEKRLYDRVKGLNSRVIRVQNLVIGGILGLLVVVLVGFRILSRRVDAFSLTGSGAAAGEDVSATGAARETAGVAAAIQEVAKRQKRLNGKLSHLNTYLEDYEEERSRLSRALNALEEEVRDIQSAVDGLQGRKE